MDGFEKIEVTPESQNSIPDSSPDAGVEVQREKRFPGFLKVFLILFAVFILVVVVLGVLVAIPAKNTYSAARETYDQVKKVNQAVKEQNIAQAKTEIIQAREKLKKVESSMQSLAWTRFTPVLGEYYNDAQHLVRAGSHGLEAGQIAIEAIEPYADVLGLKGQGSFVSGSAEERIQKTVQTFDKVTPKLSEINEKMRLVREEIDQISPGRYPENFRGKQVKGQIVALKKTVDEAQKVLSDAQPLLEVLPSLMGEPNEKKYLILFQNDKELRPTGGFITAYAVFRLEHGKMINDSAGDIYELDKKRTKKIAAPDPIKKYLPEEGGKVASQWNMRDSNLSPDFKVSMGDFESFYTQIPDAPKIDGIIAIDTHVLLKIMEVLGPIPAYGVNFTTEIIQACNCPQVIYELERFADTPTGYERGGRKDIIGVLMSAIMTKALSVSPRQYWGPLFQVGLSEIEQKHILFYLYDEKGQLGAESMNMAGRIKDFDGDYLHINDTNFAGAKSNMYVQHQVEQKIEVSDSGEVVKTLTLNYKNPQPPDNCSLERKEGLCLSATLRNWVRIYVPKGSELLETKGSEVDVTTGQDLGKTVFDGFLTVNPLGSSQMVVKYKLPFKVNKGQDLKMLIQKQPGTEGHEYKVTVNGKTIEEFPLKTDRELKLKI
ncbi:MAG: DUF4012 domain-containing protein [bacterium]|nr:DUF4012 domain-containing protein [bacterium]